jgi:BirA family biotin operon repressor/biotin-[acetyl-CoA-carboxylase] ligase
MDEGQLKRALSSLPIGRLRYFDSIGSTNDEALTWASQHARDLSLVVADEQTAGRGRSGRKWSTPKGSALAFSLILRPSAAEGAYPARITGLGALALTDSLRALGLTPKIKWPNDVLINGRKAAGILVESVWAGDALVASVLGMGVNVLGASTPPEEAVLFPATSIETELGRPVDRVDLLRAILSALVIWRKKLGLGEFIQAWDDTLAFHHEQVQAVRDQQEPLTGELIGLELDGQLVIRTADGNLQAIQFGEIHLRPAL